MRLRVKDVWFRVESLAVRVFGSLLEILDVCFGYGFPWFTPTKTILFSFFGDGD